LFELEKPSESVIQSNIERPFSLPGIFLGTSSFTAKGWEGTFYPATMRSRDFLSHYARQFQTVEIDSTFYGTPSPSTVSGWNEKTAPDFIFAVKVPQVITHEKAPELELSTNLAENSMRPVALGRKDWLHIGSPQAGPRVCGDSLGR